MTFAKKPAMGAKRTEDLEIHSAKWVVPVARPVIAHGSVVIAEGRILAVDRRSEIIRKYPGVTEKRYDSVLMPALINGHMHLELSFINDAIPLTVEQNITDWISDLIKKRENTFIGRQQIVAAFSEALKDQYASGVVLVADTGNEIFAELTDARNTDCPEVFRMLEFFAPTHQASLAAQVKIAELPDHCPVSIHAPYSTGSDLIIDVKKRCRQFGQLFSIHTAESAAELEFLRSGTGCFRDFLERRNSWDGTFSFARKGFPGTIYYYEHLGVLDENTNLIHAVHVSEEELVLVAKRGAHICLCPGSNRFLMVGRAPVEQMLGVGMLPALGTDSPASNQTIDLWREMRLLAADHPRIAPDKILAMATLGGAQALHREEDYGSLIPGTSSQILHVNSRDLIACSSASQVNEILVAGGRPSEISWITSDKA
jgi:aminodeoxyfutalosine deaminase